MRGLFVNLYLIKPVRKIEDPEYRSCCQFTRHARREAEIHKLQTQLWTHGKELAILLIISSQFNNFLMPWWNHISRMTHPSCRQFWVIRVKQKFFLYRSFPQHVGRPSASWMCGLLRQKKRGKKSLCRAGNSTQLTHYANGEVSERRLLQSPGKCSWGMTGTNNRAKVFGCFKLSDVRVTNRYKKKNSNWKSCTL